MKRGVLLILSVALALPAAAQGWFEPARGTDLRRALMDAMRPHAERALGAPVEFVVRDLRVAGPLGFAVLSAQRPGGGAIDPYRTPLYQSGRDPEIESLASIQVFYKRAGATWVATEFEFGATDVWWAQSPLCAEYGAVIPEYC